MCPCVRFILILYYCTYINIDSDVTTYLLFYSIFICIPSLLVILMLMNDEEIYTKKKEEEK